MSDENVGSTSPLVLALFQKRIDGDDALLQLAALRFGEKGLGMECYAETAAELEWLLGFRPSSDLPAAVHLGREINVLNAADADIIIDFAKRFAGRIYGMIIHDQTEIISRPDVYMSAVREVAERLEQIEGAPYLFIEYAVGLEPGLFSKVFEKIRDLRCVSACIDTGHIGLRQVSTAYSLKHPGEDVFAVRHYPARLPEVIEELQNSVLSALETVLHVIREVGSLGKPVHFHLHDGHPLSTFSPFGISDHLSFLQKIPIPFAYRGESTLDSMFGPRGLDRIVSESLKSPGGRASFAIEVHPVEGRLALADASYLFQHWKDKGNAERMNYWISVLLQNYELVTDACGKIKRNSKSKE